jgi:hypothetical protein
MSNFGCIQKAQSDMINMLKRVDGDSQMTAMIKAKEGVLCRDAWNPAFIEAVAEGGTVASKTLKEHYACFKSGATEDISVAMFDDNKEAMRVMRELQAANQLSLTATVLTVEFLF